MTGQRQAGRVAIVTGAAAGIGRAFAERLAQEGAIVVAADVAPTDGVVAAIQRSGGTGLAVVCDVADHDSVAALGERVRERHERIDTLVHCAGIYPIVPIDEITFADWRRVMSVNLDSLFLLTQAVLPEMRARGWGRILAMSSTVFHAGVPGFAHYVASKGGVIGFVRAVASEVGQDGVTINSLAPSLVRTQGTTQGPHEELGQFALVAGMQAIRRTQLPEDLVGAMAFLCSDEAAFITGQTLAVDGGFVRL